MKEIILFVYNNDRMVQNSAYRTNLTGNGSLSHLSTLRNEMLRSTCLLVLVRQTQYLEYTCIDVDPVAEGNIACGCTTDWGMVLTVS